ncbi:Thioredoxin-like protein Clot [Glycine soja]|nr:Thioredoxin-like protein Clot [Glycine soja]
MGFLTSSDQRLQQTKPISSSDPAGALVSFSSFPFSLTASLFALTHIKFSSFVVVAFTQLANENHCVRAEPVIYKKLEASPDDIALLRAYVGDRPTWRNPQHPWRMDPRFKLTGVPTLIRWENNTVKGHLEDHEAHIESKIEALVADK